jgi:hypothetical protein
VGVGVTVGEATGARGVPVAVAVPLAAVAGAKGGTAWGVLGAVGLVGVAVAAARGVAVRTTWAACWPRWASSASNSAGWARITSTSGMTMRVDKNLERMR